MSERMFSKYLILGGGAAGSNAAKTIAEIDPGTSITILSDENVISCKRPMLSKTPVGRVRSEAFFEYPPEWYERLGIKVIGGCHIESMDTERKTVSTSGGCFAYEKCIYALGGSNFIPPFKGADKPGVMTVRTVNDLRRFKRSAVNGSDIVVIGGGVIGIEMAQEFRNYGSKVTILEAMPRLMPRQLDPDSSELYQGLFDDIDIVTGVNVKEITAEAKAEGVLLEDGRYFPAAAVFISCGQKANISVAKAAGIECDRAVIVDDMMRTSANGVYACGDCAQWRGLNAALWAQAKAESEIAGINAAGGRRLLAGFDTSLVINCGPRSLFALGDMGDPSDPSYTFEVTKKIYSGFSINERPEIAVEKRVRKDGRLTGVCIIGSLRGMEGLRKELANG